VTVQPLSVSELTAYARQVLDVDPILSDVWVTGEVGGVSAPASGHLYFTLADGEAVLKCALFRNALRRQAHRPANGLQVTVHGRFDLYPRTGMLQLLVDSVQPAGLGLAALELERLRQRLAAEGLFEPSRKRPLPAMPRCIGVVTSASGAVWHDIQQTLRLRFPLVELVLSPAKVQGDGAPESIAGALAALQADGRPEVIIVARGGGSAEDLAAFNSETVVRAVFACRVPVVSGVGHETDTTLIDHVADLRASTPTAAAQLCVPSMADLRERIADAAGRLERTGATAVADRRAHAAHLLGRLARVHPGRLIDDARAELLWTRQALERAESERRGALATAVSGRRSLLAALDPRAVLDRGYAVLEDAGTGAAINRAGAAAPGMAVRARLGDGALRARVEAVAVGEALA
jgi:exodeoxyribonuclease VII large subunit